MRRVGEWLNFGVRQRSKVRYLCTNAKPFHEIPEPKWSLPYFGTVFHYRLGKYSVPNRQETLRMFREKYGPIVKERMHGETAIHLFDPDDYRAVYKVEGRIPDIIPLLTAIVEYRKQKGYSPGVGNINGEEWYRVRAAVRALMMQPMSIAKFLEREQEVANDFLERLQIIRDKQTNLVDNLELEIGKWNYETAAYLVLDRRLGSLETGEDDMPAKVMRINGDLFEKAVKFRFGIFPFYKYIRTPLWYDLVRREDIFYGHIMDLFKEAFDKCRQSLEHASEEDDGDRFLFLKYLMSRPEMSFLDCHAIGQSLFADGMSTTVPTTLGQLYCLSVNPEKQEALFKEICEVVGRTNKQVTADHLSHMPYLRSCVKEGFRFFPIGLEVSRIINKDLVLSGYHVPAGTAVELNNFAILRDERYFPKPDEYLPERWLRESSKGIRHPYAHTPFSHGPRQCLGRRFAEQEMYLLLLKLVQNFRLKWCDPRQMAQRWRFLNIPNIPAKIAFEPRE